jgi:putative ABC transport system ATP-binding protein
VALRGLELRIEPGARRASRAFGVGKSTALHLAAGLETPSAGEVRAFGQSLSRLDESELASYRARQIAIVFQSGNLWNDLSARENVELGLRLAGRRRNVTGAADRALATFGLQRKEAQRAAALSGGEQQRRDRGCGGARGAARPRRRAAAGAPTIATRGGADAQAAARMSSGAPS